MRLRIASCLLLLIPCSTWAQTADEKKATIKFLRDLQNADGGFLPMPQDPNVDQAPRSSLRGTLAAVRALRYFGGETPDRAKTAKFVASCFDDKMGGFADVPRGKPDVFLTAVGLMAVVELKMPQEAYLAKANAFLIKNTASFEDARIAVAGFEAFKKLPPEEVRQKWFATAKPNDDGTYGAGEGMARDTGSAVAMKLRLGFKVEPTAKLLDTLTGQRDDGAYGKAGVKSSDLETTYRVMRALHMLEKKPNDVERLKAFVAKCRNANGGYGVEPGKPSAAGATYYAGIILNWLK